MTKSPLPTIELPCGIIVEQPSFKAQGSEVSLDMSFAEGDTSLSVALRFIGFSALSYRITANCTPWHVKGTYHRVCEVLDSNWIKELREAFIYKERGCPVDDHHFIVYVEDFGSLEVIAKSVVLEYLAEDRARP